MDEPVEEPSGTTTESAAKVNNMSAAVENKSELITNADQVYPVESTSKKDWCCFQSCCRTNTNITREQMTGAGAMESRSLLLVPSHLMEQQQTSGYIKWTAYL